MRKHSGLSRFSAFAIAGEPGGHVTCQLWASNCLEPGRSVRLIVQRRRQSRHDACAAAELWEIRCAPGGRRAGVGASRASSNCAARERSWRDALLSQHGRIRAAADHDAALRRRPLRGVGTHVSGSWRRAIRSAPARFAARPYCGAMACRGSSIVRAIKLARAACKPPWDLPASMSTAP